MTPMRGPAIDVKVATFRELGGRAVLAVPLALVLLAGCPTAPTRPAASKAPSPQAVKPTASKTPAVPTLPPASFPPILVPSPPPSPHGIQVSTLAGQPKVNETLDGPAASARLNFPSGLALGPDGALYFSEPDGHRVRKLDLADPALPVTTVAGGGLKPLKGGPTTGPATSVYLRKPWGLAFTADGKLLIADEEEHAVKLVDFKAAGGPTLSLLAGSGAAGTADGAAASATFGAPSDVAVGPDGTVYVVDASYNRVRTIAPGGQVGTLAGSGPAQDGKQPPFFADGPAEKAIFYAPRGLALDAAGTVYVADTGNNLIRRIKGGQVTTVAGASEGFADGFWRGAQFSAPWGLRLDAAGNLLVADLANHRVRRITPLGDVVTLAGGGPVDLGTSNNGVVDGAAADARFDAPFWAVEAPDGTIYVTDQHNGCIRKLTGAR